MAADLVHAGHVAEWDFKSCVLGTMFYRFILKNLSAYINDGERAAGNEGFGRGGPGTSSAAYQEV